MDFSKIGLLRTHGETFIGLSTNVNLHAGLSDTPKMYNIFANVNNIIHFLYSFLCIYNVNLYC